MGLIRYRLASKLIKGQALGGLAEEWVVIEPVYRAVELAEQLLDQPGPDCDLQSYLTLIIIPHRRQNAGRAHADAARRR